MTCMMICTGDPNDYDASLWLERQFLS